MKQITGLDINHLVNVDFTGFARAVNAIGCVYVDVDHRYYHQNSPYAPRDDYAEINLQPGYQAPLRVRRPLIRRATATPTTTSSAPPGSRRSCARPARRCLRTKLIDDRNKLVKIFTHYTSSDINIRRADARMC